MANNDALSMLVPVLVVDDNEADRRWVAVHLAEAWPFPGGLSLSYAGDGHEALRQLRVRQFGLVVLDWNLMEMTGGEILRALRARGNHVPVLVVSGVDRCDIFEDLDALGAAYLHKNRLNTVGLHRAIAHALALRTVSPAAVQPKGLTPELDSKRVLRH